ncbi:MAG: amidohydrolase family protein [Burkholderiales bacterium]
MPKIPRTLIAAAATAGLMMTTAVRADDDRDECKGRQSIRLVNGKIHTMDAKDRVVSSVLMRGGRFAAVGRESDGDGGGCIKAINLRGRRVVPGTIDNHNHIVLLGLRPGHDTRLENANSIQEALDTLAARAARVRVRE